MKKANECIVPCYVVLLAFVWVFFPFLENFVLQKNRSVCTLSIFSLKHWGPHRNCPNIFVRVRVHVCASKSEGREEALHRSAVVWKSDVK